jgi:DNA modification methylase
VLRGDAGRLPLPDASVDAIVCDPPYGLEFMGKEWDSFRPGGKRPGLGSADGSPMRRNTGTPSWGATGNPGCRRCGGQRYGNNPDRQCGCPVPDFGNPMGGQMHAFQAWCTEWAVEALRVLKPGGHLLAFGGTRTYHRLTCAIEDAGFEIRDSIGCLSWVYACLSDDTEILTEHGWQPGVDVAVGDRVAQWDPETGAVSLAAVQRKYRGPYSGPMIRFRSADTDQLVTPNHRVYHRPRQRQMTSGVRRAWYGDRWEVAEASTINRWNPIRLPVAGVHDGPGIGGTDYAALLGWVWTEGGFDRAGSGVRLYQSSANPEKCDEIAALLDRLGPHKRYDRERTWTYKGTSREYVESCWFWTGDLAARVRADLPEKRPTYELLWQMTAAEKEAFYAAAMAGDGSHGQFYQRDRADLEWFQTLAAVTGRRATVTMRKAPRTGGAVNTDPRAETELQGRHLRDAAEDYAGLVWCVGVPTGAFLARRNGRVFITGNSGFPKSLDVSKAIDKAGGDPLAFLTFARAYAAAVAASGLTHADIDRRLGVASSSCYWVREDHRGKLPPRHHWEQVRELLGLAPALEKLYEEAERADRVVTGPAGNTVFSPTQRVLDAGTPQTPAAVRWQGWGTALKPAWEPIVVARRSLAGTVAANVLAYGTGGINVDGCRVATDDVLTGSGTPPLQYGGANARPFHAAAEPRGVAQNPAGRWPTNFLLVHHPDCADRCVPGCHVAELDAQSGITKSSGGSGARSGQLGYHGGGNGNVGSHAGGLGDTGGASRFYPTFRFNAKADTAERPTIVQPDGTVLAHPTVKPVDLMRWLVRLVTPPGGLVLDPFAGSGATLQAAQVERFRAIGIEKEPCGRCPGGCPDHIKLIRERLSWPVQVNRDGNFERLRPEAVPAGQLDIFGELTT